MSPFEWSEPTTLDDLGAALGDASTAIKAGGIDLLDLMKEGLVGPSRLVGLGRVAELGAVEPTSQGGLRIGARVTLAEVAAHAAIRERWQALSDAAGRAATPQVRNVATLGGNLLQRSRCGYYRSIHFPCRRKGGDTCFAQTGRNRHHAILDNAVCAMVHPSTPATALVALGAEILLRSAAGEVRRLPIESFFVAPSVAVDRETVKAHDEILVAVELPPVDATFRSRHLEQGGRESFVWPIADVAVALRLVNGRVRSPRIVMGAAAPLPVRRKAAERIVDGRPLDVHVADRAAEASLEGARPLEENVYKLLVFRSIVRRALLDAIS